MGSSLRFHPAMRAVAAASALALLAAAHPSVAHADAAVAAVERQDDTLGPFNVLVRPGAIREAAIAPGISHDGEVAALFDGRPETGVVFTFAGGEAEIDLLEVVLSKAHEGVEVEIFFDSAGSDLGTTTIFQAARIRASDTVTFESVADSNAAVGVAPILSYQVRDPASDPDPALDRLSVWLPQLTGPLRVRITEVTFFERATPTALNDAASAEMHDAHFHPCSFSNFCPPVSELVQQQQLYGVGSAFVFGLQHNLMLGASPWANLLIEPYDEDQLRLPFHYADPGAKPSTDPTGPVPGIATLNRARLDEWPRQAPLVDYHGWPVYPTTLADWRTLTGYQAAGEAVTGRLYPFLSSIRLVHQEAQPDLLYGVCTRRNGSERTVNEELLDAMDTLFPGAIHGFAEYNLNKVVLFAHDSFAPEIDDAWIACMTPIMRRLADTGRPIGFHMDLADDQAGLAGYDKLTRVAQAFPETRMIWHHGGSAPEAPNTLSAKAHIGLMEAYLATSPGNRYIDLSWPNGFFLRLNPAFLGDTEIDPVTGATVPRDWPQDFADYMSFLNAHSQSLMFGSDQVAVDFPGSNSENLIGTGFINHAAYLQGQTYGAGLRKELALLVRAQDAAAGGARLEVESIDNLFSKTARQLMAGVKPTEAVPSQEDQDQARAIVRSIIELQYRELVAVSGPNAPALNEFLPPDLQWKSTAAGLR